MYTNSSGQPWQPVWFYSLLWENPSLLTIEVIIQDPGRDPDVQRHSAVSCSSMSGSLATKPELYLVDLCCIRPSECLWSLATKPELGYHLEEAIVTEVVQHRLSFLMTKPSP